MKQEIKFRALHPVTGEIEDIESIDFADRWVMFSDGDVFKIDEVEMHQVKDGLTKREEACIRLKVPNSGDDELDELIRQSLKQDATMAAMQGISSDVSLNAKEVAELSVEYADALLEELNK